MWNHVAIVALAATAAVAAAEGIIQLDARQAARNHATAGATVAARPAVSDASAAKDVDGHYWAEASVNGRRVRFLVDTGATAVALTLSDARRLGLEVDRLPFNQTVRTAGGEAHAAQVELDYVSVGGARVDKVAALVLDKGLPASLLGMTYLGRLSRFEATPSALILRP